MGLLIFRPNPGPIVSSSTQLMVTPSYYLLRPKPKSHSEIFSFSHIPYLASFTIRKQAFQNTSRTPSLLTTYLLRIDLVPDHFSPLSPPPSCSSCHYHTPVFLWESASWSPCFLPYCSSFCSQPAT